MNGWPLVILLGIAISGAYVASLWWLLRREGRAPLAAVLAVSVLALCLRLPVPIGLPAGLNNDEVKTLASALEHLEHGLLFRASSQGFPVLLNAVFQAPLAYVTGSNFFWAIRLYPLVTSVLSVPLAFAALRALGGSVMGAWAASALFAVLPWSILYGRWMFGGEMVFHEMLVIAAVAHLVFVGPALAAVALGALGLGLLQYDYWCGQTMLLLPLVAAVLARGWRARTACLAVLLGGLMLWAPYLHRYGIGALAPFAPILQGGSHVFDPLGAAGRVFATFVTPTAVDRLSFSTVGAAQHPLIVLAFAGLGIAVTGRRGVFVLGGMLVGLLAPLLGGFASAHRMLMAFPFVALAAALGMDQLRRWRWFMPVAVAIIGVLSVRLYVSEKFWGTELWHQAEPDLTALMADLPRTSPPRLILDRNLNYYLEVKERLGEPLERLTVENSIPDDGGALLVFSRAWAALRPFWEGLAGPERVRVYGRVFTVALEGGDWSWLRRHGWAYGVEYGDGTVRHGHVLALFSVPYFEFSGPARPGPARHAWTARWNGPPTTLILRWTGAAEVHRDGHQVLVDGGRERVAQFEVRPDERIAVTVSVPDAMHWAALFEATPTDEQAPAWERFTPVAD